MDKLPVNALYHYEDLLPWSVSPGLPVNYGFSQQFLKALHVWQEKVRERVAFKMKGVVSTVAAENHWQLEIHQKKVIHSPTQFQYTPKQSVDKLTILSIVFCQKHNNRTESDYSIKLHLFLAH